MVKIMGVRGGVIGNTELLRSSPQIIGMRSPGCQDRAAADGLPAFDSRSLKNFRENYSVQDMEAW